MEKYKTDFLSLHHCDCMDLMKQYPDKYFDLAIVDPPYGINLAEWDKYTPKQEYFNEVIRVSKNQIIWGGNYFVDKLPITEAWICWYKKPFLKQQAHFELAWSSFDIKPKMFEYTYAGNAEGLNNIKVDYTKKSIHPAQKPENIYSLLINEFAAEGMKLLDTHFGSGSIALAVNKANQLDKMNLHLTACEIDEEYINKAIERINFSIKQTTLNF